MSEHYKKYLVGTTKNHNIKNIITPNPDKAQNTFVGIIFKLLIKIKMD
jgi:hypothetical protein